MFQSLSFLVFLVFYGAYAQDCVPQNVRNPVLDLNYVLHWDPSTNCPDTTYLVYVQIEDILQRIYNTETTSLDLSSLPACERFDIIIRAYSNHEISEGTHIEAIIPAPSGTNLTIVQFNATRQGRGILLDWQVDEKFAHCARAFRVVIRDDWFVPREVYTQNTNIFIDDLVPCGRYEFTVTAIYNQQSEGPIVLHNYIIPDERTPPPTLAEIAVSPNNANMTYRLPSYESNRCAITAIFVSSQFYSRTYNIQDTPARPPVSIDMGPLQPDSMYFLRVAVVNSAGTSEPLPIAVQTDPL